VRVGGDIIVGIDDKSVGGMDDLITYLETRQVGQQVVLTVIREEQEQKVEVILKERPDG
jgi:serine protease Do